MNDLAVHDEIYNDMVAVLSREQARYDELIRAAAKNPSDTGLRAQLLEVKAKINSDQKALNDLDEIRENIAAEEEAARLAVWAKKKADQIAQINRRAEARIKEKAKPVDEAVLQLARTLRALAADGEGIYELACGVALSREKDLSHSSSGSRIAQIRQYAMGEFANAVIRGVMTALSAIDTHGQIEYPGMITGPGHESTVEDCARVAAEHLRHCLQA